MCSIYGFEKPIYTKNKYLVDNAMRLKALMMKLHHVFIITIVFPYIFVSYHFKWDNLINMK